MALEARGNSLQEAMNSLVESANQQGGASAQDPAARAVYQASQQKGDLMSNLQQMGAGGMLDPQIRQIQQQAERNGWTEQDRRLVQGLRKYQSGGAQDARALEKVNITPTGSGGGNYSGGGSSGGSMGGDELSMIAQLLGKYRGNLDYNTHNQSVGMDANFNKSIVSEDSQMVGALQPLYDELLKQKKLETRLMSSKARESNRPPARMAEFGNRESMANSMNNSWSIRRDDEVEDANRDVRRQALEAALRYMKINNPHRTGSI